MSEPGLPVVRREGPGRAACFRAGAAAPRRRSFTLVELLVVMGIFALLMAIAVPAFLNRSPSIAAAGAVSRLKSTVSLARQWAVTRRTTTYVVFPHNFTFANNQEWAATALRGFNIWTAEEGYLNEWQFLPPGFVFHTTSQPTKNVFSQGYLVPIRFPKNTNVVFNVRSIAFRPNGALLNNSTVLEVLFTSGSLDADLGTGTVSNLLISAGAPIYGVQVQPLTGRPRPLEY